MKVKKRYVKLLGVILIVIAIAWYMTRPVYPEIYTPKPIIGNANSKIEVIEFSDLQCPACKRAQPVIEKAVEDTNVSLKYYHMPLAIHRHAQKAAEAAECANDQGKFYEFVKVAYLKSPNLDTTSLKQIAQMLELDTDAFEKCLDSAAKEKQVVGEYKMGVAMGVTGTPTVFVNNKKVASWDYDTLKAAIEAEKK